MKQEMNNPMTIISNCISDKNGFECEKLTEAICLKLNISEHKIMD